MSSSLGFQFLIYALWRGGTAFFPGDNFENTLRAFEDYKVQCLVGSPGGFENLLRWFDVIPVVPEQHRGHVLRRRRPVALAVKPAALAHLLASDSGLWLDRGEHVGDRARARDRRCAARGRLRDARRHRSDRRCVGHDSAAGPGGRGAGEERLCASTAISAIPRSRRKVFRNGWFYPGDIGTLSADNLLGRHRARAGRAQSRRRQDQSGDDRGGAVAVQGRHRGGGLQPCPTSTASTRFARSVVSAEKLDEQPLRAHCEELHCRGHSRRPNTFSSTVCRTTKWARSTAAVCRMLVNQRGWPPVVAPRFRWAA